MKRTLNIHNRDTELDVEVGGRTILPGEGLAIELEDGEPVGIASTGEPGQEHFIGLWGYKMPGWRLYWRTDTGGSAVSVSEVLGGRVRGIQVDLGKFGYQDFSLFSLAGG